MGRFITDHGQFQSDKNPDLPPDRITLNFYDDDARTALLVYADICSNKELAADIRERVESIEERKFAGGPAPSTDS